MNPCSHCDINAELREIKAVLKRVEQSIEGNGRKGLRERVEVLEKWRAGIVAVLLFIVGWLKLKSA